MKFVYNAQLTTSKHTLNTVHLHQQSHTRVPPPSTHTDTECCKAQSGTPITAGTSLLCAHHYRPRSHQQTLLLSLQTLWISVTFNSIAELRKYHSTLLLFKWFCKVTKNSAESHQKVAKKPPKVTERSTQGQ